MSQVDLSKSELINLKHWVIAWVLSTDKPTVTKLKETAVHTAKFLNENETQLIDEILRELVSRGLITIRDDGTIIPNEKLRQLGRQALKALTRIHWARKRARRLLRSKKQLSQDDWAQLRKLLEAYLNEMAQKAIVLRNRDTGEIVLLHYSHRFQVSRLLALEAELESAFEKASQKYETAVFITLTMDPKRYRSIAHAVRQAEEAWKKFYWYIRDLAEKRGIENWDYIRVIEAQDSGSPHFHVVIFGFRRIEDHYKLTPKLVELGFGKIHYEYKLENRNGKWSWAKAKPEDATSDDVRDYLKKYLRKSITGFLTTLRADGNPQIASDKVAWYFATGKRFFTVSRGITEPTKRRYSSGLWEYLGTYNWQEVEEQFGIELDWDPRRNTWYRSYVNIKYG